MQIIPIITFLLRLFEKGILQIAGFQITTDENNNVVKLPIPEEIHTYIGWKQRGFQVKKGSKSVATLQIWKSGKRKNSDEKENEPEEYMFLTKAFFFSSNQVERIYNEESSS